MNTDSLGSQIFRNVMKGEILNSQSFCGTFSSSEMWKKCKNISNLFLLNPQLL